MPARFEYRQAQEIAATFCNNAVVAAHRNDKVRGRGPQEAPVRPIPVVAWLVAMDVAVEQPQRLTVPIGSCSEVGQPGNQVSLFA